MDHCEIFVLYFFVFLNLTNALQMNSCSKDDFYLRKNVGRNVIFPGEIIDVENVRTYQQCFGYCQRYACSLFNFEEVAAGNFKCGVYPGPEFISRYSPKTRFGIEPVHRFFFEKVPCQTDESSEYSFKGTFLEAENCKEVQENGGGETGIYEVRVIGQPGQSRYIVCNMDLMDGGWTLFQRNYGPSHINFGKRWADYKSGFGDLRYPFWAGNDFLHQLTQNEDTELLVVLKDPDGDDHYAYFTTFYIDDENAKYRLTIGGYEVVLTPALPQQSGAEQFMYHNQMVFVTSDNAPLGIACGTQYNNGWWYNNCFRVALNGDPNFVLPTSGTNTPLGIMWRLEVGGNWMIFRESTMMVRKK
ncbi:ficolin-1-like [Clytia hemisphaerica]|uniref:Fibrinogen C-terminal domain-containing protein n=1 Tax=Clytia hemisphaerica TaxID=252671 RepID=A0A7M5UFN7_9CNID